MDVREPVVKGESRLDAMRISCLVARASEILPLLLLPHALSIPILMPTPQDFVVDSFHLDDVMTGSVRFMSVSRPIVAAHVSTLPGDGMDQAPS